MSASQSAILTSLSSHVGFGPRTRRAACGSRGLPLVSLRMGLFSLRLSPSPLRRVRTHRNVRTCARIAPGPGSTLRIDDDHLAVLRGPVCSVHGVAQSPRSPHAVLTLCLPVSAHASRWCERRAPVFGEVLMFGSCGDERSFICYLLYSLRL